MKNKNLLMYLVLAALIYFMAYFLFSCSEVKARDQMVYPNYVVYCVEGVRYLRIEASVVLQTSLDGKPMSCPSKGK